MLKYNLVDGINQLVPGAKFKGTFINHNEIEYGTITWLDYRPKPSFIEVDQATLKVLRRNIRVVINEKTTEIIKHFNYNGNLLYMNLEFQFNISQLVMMKDMLPYPYTMKIHDDEDGCGVYMTLNNSDELMQLYQAGFTYVSQVLAEGRQLKDQLKNMTRTELEEFQDTREVYQPTVD